jgi:preprotein translocase subunit YajC
MNRAEFCGLLRGAWMDEFMTGVLKSLEPAAAGAQRSLWVDLFPLALIAGIFYFLLIRPQQQQRKTHDAMLTSLVKGNRVVTSSGLHGRIVSVSDATLVVEIGDKTKVTIDKVAIARRLETKDPK